MANGDKIKLGTLYMDNVKQKFPTKPYHSFTGEDGDIPNYPHNNKSLEILDTDSSDEYKINWVEVNDGGKKLLIADRCIVKYISWTELNSQGLISGKEVVIDGDMYLLRVLSGGSKERVRVPAPEGTWLDDYLYGGIPTDNEWDRIIANEGNFNGLPVPKDEDLAYNINNKDSHHNKFWNWYNIETIVKERNPSIDTKFVTRGDDGVIAFYYRNGATEGLGWRPVLEFISSKPTISSEDGDIGNYNTPLTKQYSVTDKENETFSIVEKLNGEEVRVLNNQTNGNFTLNLASSWYKAIVGRNTIEIIVTDSKGLTSKRTWTFTKLCTSGVLEFKTLKQDVEYQPKVINVIDKCSFRKSQGGDLKITVKACNNANDSLIIWEDITESYLSGKSYTFMNETKTSNKWSVIIHYKIEANGYIGEVSVSSIGIGVL